jgi:ABC-type antimicrobial peptide transport system, permease component
VRLRRRRSDVASLATLGVSVSKLSTRDLIGQAIGATARRPGRSLATALGTAVGVGAVVTTLGIASTAAHQVNAQFDALRATEVSVQDARLEDPSVHSTPIQALYPRSGLTRLRTLSGVAHAGVLFSLPALAVATVPGGSSQLTPFLAADPSALAAIHVRLRSGRAYDSFDEDRQQPVALLGSDAASRLGVSRVDNQPSIWVAGRALTIVGIVDDVQRRPSARLGIILPVGTAELIAAGTRTAEKAPELIVETSPGAAETVAAQAPTAIHPEDPTRLRSIAPPDPATLRRAIGGNLDSLFLLLGAVSLTIGAIGIANTTLVAVLERTPEIGLRRAIGAGRGHIAAQFLVETMITGTYGGLLGASLGTTLVVVIAAFRNWAPTLDIGIILLAPLLGTATGLLAGLQPAWRAANIEPTDALRR